MKFRLAVFFLASSLLYADDHRAKIVLEDGTSLRTTPMIVPTRTGICAILNFFLDGTIIYRTAFVHIMSGQKENDQCPVMIRLNGYQPYEALLTEGMVVVLKRVGEHHEGVTVSRTSIEVPKAARKAYESGVAAVISKKFPAAQKHLENAVALYPKYASAWIELGGVFIQEKQFDDARNAYNKALEADPKYMRPYVELARLELSLSHSQEAADIAARALALNTMEYDPGIFFYAGVANFNLKKFDVAEKLALRAVDLDTTHQIPRSELLVGRILIAKGDLKGAAEHLRKYLALNPKAPDTAEVQQMIARTGVQ